MNRSCKTLALIAAAVTAGTCPAHAQLYQSTSGVQLGGSPTFQATSSYNIGASVVRTIPSTANPGGPTFFVNLENQSTSYIPTYGTIYGGVPALQINVQNDAGAQGSMLGAQVNLNSYDGNAYNDENVGYDSHVYKRGQGSTWMFNGETDDSTGLPPSSFAAMGMELDILSNGPDVAASLYDPQQANRRFMYFGPKEYSLNGWVKSTAYAAGTLVQANNPSGVSSVYIVTKAGTSSTAAPTWPASGTVTDGGVTWTYGEPYAMSVGTAMWLDNGEDTNASYNTGIGTNGIFNNAVLDFSEATFAGSSTAAIRLPQNAAIDFTGNATQAGKNQHFMSWTNYLSQNALIYNNPSGTAFSIADTNSAARFSGTVTAAGFVGDGSKLTNLPSGTGGGTSSSITQDATGKTISASDCSTTINYTGSAAHTYAIPTTLAINCRIGFIQGAAGAFTLSGANIVPPPGYSTTSAGTGASIGVIVSSSSTQILTQTLP